MFEVLSYLNRNQLKELSSDIFRNNTQLIKLQVRKAIIF